MVASENMLIPVALGPRHEIYFYVNALGNSQALAFMNGLDTRDQAKLAALFEQTCLSGRKVNPDQFKYELNEIYAFKVRQVRFYCFFDDKIIVLTNGAIKKQQKARKQDLEKAARMRNEYLERKGGHGNLG